MTISRRDFFKGTAVLGTTLLGTRKSFSETPPAGLEYRFPVLQGATSFTKTQINVMAAEEITITVSQGKVTVEKITKTYSVWQAYRIVVEDLLPGTEYELQIATATGVVETRKFSTLSPDKTQVKIALASCMRDTRAEHQAVMWKAMEDTKPDLLFLLGDNVYVDDEKNTDKFISEERIWRRYVETRLTLDLYQWKKLVPTIATWDDHDFGLNNTLGAVPWRDASTLVFRTLYAQDAVMPEVGWGPGISTSYSAYGQRFFLMDNRSFRGYKFIGKNHWGINQEEWLFNLVSQEKTPGWILTGSQVFGGYRSGWSFENNHPGALKRVLSRLSKIEAPVLFGSGDVHYSEIMKIEKERLGYETIEITSSSMHSNARDPKPNNKRRIASTGEFNFVVAMVEAKSSALQMNLRSLGAGGKELFAVNQITINR